MNFREPLLLFLVVLIPILIYLHLKKSSRATVTFSSLDNLKRLPSSWTLLGRHLLTFLRCLAITLVIFALARPQKGKEETKITAEGIDINLCIDVSGSMLAEDFTDSRGRRQNRLEVVKEVVKDFIQKRVNDRIGVVVFAGRPYTLCPLTFDHGWILEQMDRAEIGMIEDGTAIGSAIGTGLNRLRESEAKSRIIVLLTDGRNNAGRIAPETAAETAKALKVKVYTIGAGTKGMAPFPAKDWFGNKIYRPVKIEIDDESLQKIAQKTGGKYFRATDTRSLQDIYKEIDRMEKTKIEMPRFLEYRELYPKFLIPALACLLLEIGLANTRFRRIP